MQARNRQFGGQGLARLEREFGASAAKPLSLNQLLELLGPANGDEVSRRQKIACYLAGADGWEEALRELGGAFADGEARLTDGHAE